MMIALLIGICLPFLVGLLLLATPLGSKPSKDSDSPYVGL
jgi:hypothetical protein